MSAMLKQKLIDIANGFTKYGLWKGGGSNSLSELDDVTLTNLQSNDVLTYNGSEWVNDDNLQNQIDTLNSNFENLSLHNTIGQITSTYYTEFDIDFSKYRYICIAFVNSLGSIYNMNIIPVSLFQRITSSMPYINNMYTDKRYMINAYCNGQKVVAKINNTELKGIIYGIK